MTHHLQLGTAGHDGYIAVLVGAPDRHVQPGQRVQQARCRVTVGVVQSNRDHRHLGVDCGQERRVEVGAAVVGHLQDVRGEVLPAGHERLLGLGRRVAGEQDRMTGDRRADHQRRVVGIRLAVDVDDV
jgi:hypothetical protein